MSKVNAFLQKRKMHESRHGLRMIVISYALSFVLLFFGSDALYNIKTGAKDTNSNTLKANILAEPQDVEMYSYVKAQTAQTSFLNSYFYNNYIATMDLPIADVTDKQETEELESNDAYWLLGYSMDKEEYSELVYQIDGSDYSSSENQDIHSEGNQISSFSTDAIVEDKVEDKDKDHAKVQANDKVEDKAKDKSKDKSKESSDKVDKKEDKQEVKAVMSLSAEDISLLEKIVQAEAGGEDMKGKILIANVVFNRIKDDEFPNTIKKVVYQKVGGKYQFSPVANKNFSKTKVSKDTEEAVERALEGEDYSEGALYFMSRRKSKKKSATWFDKNLDRLFKHGGHEFFK